MGTLGRGWVVEVGDAEGSSGSLGAALREPRGERGPPSLLVLTERTRIGGELGGGGLHMKKNKMCK